MLPLNDVAITTKTLIHTDNLTLRLHLWDPIRTSIKVEIKQQQYLSQQFKATTASVYTSLSHTSGAFIVSEGNLPLGIDIESTTRQSKRLSRLKQKEEPLELDFLRHHSAKEALSKALGKPYLYHRSKYTVIQSKENAITLRAFDKFYSINQLITHHYLISYVQLENKI